jgi:hypothetical protein
MKTPFCIRRSHSLRLAVLVAALLVPGLSAKAVTFTNDTLISSYNTSYDGMDVTVTNCTLTLDGAHSFASLRVLTGGRLTHTFAAGGVVYNYRTITNEPQALSATNAATLSRTNVVSATIVVQDESGQITYTNAVDYILVPTTNTVTILLRTSDSAIVEGSTNRVSYQYLDSTIAAGLSLTVTGDVTVAHGGMVEADGARSDPVRARGRALP